jgi:2-aminobenzoate-CoA ligase
MSERTAHVDTFARDRLPPPEQAPNLDWSSSPVYPARLNAATELLDGALRRGWGDRVALRQAGVTVTYAELLARANRVANVLVREHGLVPGGRVLLRAPNTIGLVVAWFAVLKAGGIVVATMPMLRARELTYIVGKAKVPLALCDRALVGELAPAGCADVLVLDELEARAAVASPEFAGVDTAADDIALIAFTSGTTGMAKGAMHFHRDLLVVADLFSPEILKPTMDDVFCGSPPIAFTFGLGALLLFPMRVGASTVLVEKPSPDALLGAIAKEKATILFTAPTMFRALCDLVKDYDLRSLTKAVSAGETLPAVTYEAWRKATGIRIIDGLGSTEMLHIFVACAGDDIRPGATGKALRGYEVRVVDDELRTVPPGTIGRLAVRGPTGCRYLDDPDRQRAYVQDGWNLTGDAYKMDEEGYFWFQARADDMIISAGYNISGPEVEAVLLEHPKVKECAVVSAPDEARGFIVKAFVVLRDPAHATDATTDELKDHVKAMIAPYKYPRAVAYLESLPKTENGKVQRYKLRGGA